MFALIGKLAVVAITLGTALANCGNPAGTDARIDGAAASCLGYNYSFAGFPTDGDIAIHSVFVKKDPDGTQTLLAENTDHTNHQATNFFIDHTGSTKLTSAAFDGFVSFDWNTDGAKRQTYVAHITSAC